MVPEANDRATWSSLGETYADIIERRRALKIEGYVTLAEAGFDGPWVTPYQISSASPDGVVLVAYNWLDAPSAAEHREVLLRCGYLPNINFNAVLDRALTALGLDRSDLYITQAFHLLPATRSAAIPQRDVDVSFDTVTRHELAGRRVVALGAAAARACRTHGVAALEAIHPSARGLSFDARAKLIAAALTEAGA